MCGIVGVLSGDAKEGKGRGDFFHQALYADALRGWDSTGVFSVGASREAQIFKRANTAADFITMRGYEEIMRKYNTTDYLIGHNRKATKGGVNNNNAHPFSFGNITMVHNGTLTNHRTLPQGNTFIVDSEAFVNSMNALGTVETLQRVRGAFAVVWHDALDNTVSICRNDERPLSYAYCKDSNTVLIASEMFMLMWLAGRNGLALESTHRLEIGCIVTFQREDIRNPSVKKIKLAADNSSRWFGEDYDQFGNCCEGSKVMEALPDKTAKRGKAKGKNEKKQEAADGNTNSSQIALLDNKRQKKIQLRAEHHSLKLETEVIFEGVSFELYGNGKKTGVLQGLYTGEDGKSLLVEAHAMLPASYDDEGVYSAVLQSMRLADEAHNDVLIVYNTELVYTPKDEVETPDATFRGPSDKYVSKAKYEELVSGGCIWCGDVISLGDSECISWGNNQTDPICESCTADADTVGGIDGHLLT